MALEAKEKPWFPNIPNDGTVIMTNSTLLSTLGAITNMQTLITAGDLGTIVDSIAVNSTDSAAMFLYFAIIEGSTCKALFGLLVPAGSGDSSSATTVDGLSSVYASALPIDGNGKRYIRLKAGDTLSVGLKATITPAKTVTVTASGTDYED
jgi:hypothetical protein